MSDNRQDLSQIRREQDALVNGHITFPDTPLAADLYPQPQQSVVAAHDEAALAMDDAEFALHQTDCAMCEDFGRPTLTCGEAIGWQEDGTVQIVCRKSRGHEWPHANPHSATGLLT